MAKRTNKSSQKRQPHLKKENDAIIDDHSEFSPTPSKGIRKAKMPKLPKDLEKKTDWNAIITPLSQLSENIDYKTNPFVEGSKYGTFFMWLKKGIYKIEGIPDAVPYISGTNSKCVKFSLIQKVTKNIITFALMVVNIHPSA